MERHSEANRRNWCVQLLRTKSAARWPTSRVGKVFVAALLPFGPFVLPRPLGVLRMSATSPFFILSSRFGRPS